MSQPAANRLPFESELIARIGWLVRLRWVAVAGVVLAIVLAVIWFPGAVALVPLVSITTGIALYNLFFVLHLRSLKRSPAAAPKLRPAVRSAQAQIVLDMVALAALIHYAGGLENPMALFFVFHVIIASILLRPRVSYLMAGLATVLLAVVAGMEYAGVWRHHHLPLLGVELYHEFYYLLILITGMALTLFLVAYLTTSIVVRLRERDRELLESNTTCQLRSVELEDLNDQLQHIDTQRTRFMVLVTHELRAPINTIYSALDLALSGIASPEKSRDVLLRAQSRATELLDLINDLLDLTKVREATPHLEGLTRVQLDDVLNGVVTFMQVEAEAKELSLDVDIAPDLAPVNALPDQIKLVWTNLLSNAIKYSESGGNIWISLRQDEKHVIGTVRDTGIGIAPEDVPRVFDEFFRAGNAREVSSHGTGVGLAIVQRTIENFGGSIRAESGTGQGALFTFVLPRADV